MKILFFSLGLLVFFILPIGIMKWRYKKAIWDSFKWLVKNGSKKLPFSTTEDYGMGKGFVYCPHPFTNWSLNPSYRNRFGESEHTVEGFRKTQGESSILQLVNENPDSYKIVCIGGSTTYCTGVERYRHTWPALLRKRLNKHNTLVFNFGVAHWATIQSIIRCVTWLPVVRPDLLIFYQAKNDLNALTNMMDDERHAYPDYQNVMRQFSQALKIGFPKPLLFIPFFALLEIRRLRRLSFRNLYRVKPDIRRIPKFLNNDVINGIVFRTKALFKICEAMNCRVMYIPEIVREGEYRATLYKGVYNRISQIIRQCDNVDLFEIRGRIPETEEFFTDKMHFNDRGCSTFAERIAEEIFKNDTASS